MTGSLDYIRDKANIQFKSVNFMRGRSIQNALVLLDECQNLTAAQLKTIITRCGEGTKLVCSGNLAQIDSNYLTSYPILELVSMLLPHRFYCSEQGVTRITRKSLPFTLKNTAQIHKLLPLISANERLYEMNLLKEVA